MTGSLVRVVTDALNRVSVVLQTYVTDRHITVKGQLLENCTADVVVEADPFRSLTATPTCEQQAKYQFTHF